jgi:hypothetical protein
LKWIFMVDEATDRTRSRPLVADHAAAGRGNCRLFALANAAVVDLLEIAMPW